MNKTKIEWTDATWSPIRARVKVDAADIAAVRGWLDLRDICLKMAGHVGPHCEQVSPGCHNCYSKTNNHRCLPSNGTGLPFDKRSRELVDIFIDEKILTQPLKWKAPRKIFVENQSDLFGEWVPSEMIDKVFAVMALCPQHSMQVLSKRPVRMAAYFRSNPLERIAALIHNAMYEQRAGSSFERAIRDRFIGLYLEDRKTSRERRQAGWWLLQGRRNKSLPESTGGVLDAVGISVGGSNDRQEENSDRISSSCMVPFQQSEDRSGPDNQSQEWDQVRQPPGQLGTGNIQRAEISRNSCSRGETSRRQRLEASEDTLVGGECHGNAAPSDVRNDGEGYRHTVPHDEEGYFGDLLPSDVAAYLTWPLPNVWLGVSVEDQKMADERIPLLLQTPADVRFVSYEPALGPVSFDSYPGPLKCDGCGYTKKDKQELFDHALCRNKTATLDQVIVGGESGAGARPFEIAWARSVIRQCRAAGVACFVKQLGAEVRERNDRIADIWYYADGSDMDTEAIDADSCSFQGQPVRLKLRDRKGGDMAEWPEDLRVREFPEVRA